MGVKYHCERCDKDIGTSDDDVLNHIMDYHPEETGNVKDRIIEFMEQHISEEIDVVVIEA